MELFMMMQMMFAELTGSVTLGLAGAGAGIGVGLVGYGATQAVGRNPGAFGQILTIGIRNRMQQEVNLPKLLTGPLHDGSNVE